jgi:hypothetical protein
MNYRRSLLRVWIAGSACWIAYWIWHYATTCRLVTMSGGHAISCRWETTEAGGVAVASRTGPALAVLWDMLARVFGIPACAVVAGLAVYWAIERFRRQAP